MALFLSWFGGNVKIGAYSKLSPSLQEICRRKAGLRRFRVDGDPSTCYPCARLKRVLRVRRLLRAEGDFLVRALTDLVSQCRRQIRQLEHEFQELEKLAGERELPRYFAQPMHHMSRRQKRLGLTETELCE